MEDQAFSIDFPPELQRSYDYIVVGAGAAGILSATLLANYDKQSPPFSVLLVERGDQFSPDNPTLTEPQYVHALSEKPDEYPQFFKETQRGPMARLVGGRAAVDDEQFVIGSDSYFQREGLYDYRTAFRDLEQAGFIQTRLTFAGPQEEEVVNILSQAFRNVKKINIANGLNYNSEGVDSCVIFNKWELTQFEDQTRSSPQRILLGGKRKPANLTVLSKAYVWRLMYKATRDSNTVTALPEIQAIALSYSGRKFSVECKKTVILCAGLGTSSILLRSGIGPFKALGAANVRLRVVDSAMVGANIYNHNFVSMRSVLTKPVLVNQTQVDIGKLAKNLYCGGAFVPETGNGNVRQVQAAGKIAMSAVDRKFSITGIRTGNPSELKWWIKLLKPKDHLNMSIVDREGQAVMKSSRESVSTIGMSDEESFRQPVEALKQSLARFQYQVAVVSTEEKRPVSEDIPIHMGFHWMGGAQAGESKETAVCSRQVLGRVFGIENDTLYVADGSLTSTPYDGSSTSLSYLMAFLVTKGILSRLPVQAISTTVPCPPTTAPAVPQAPVPVPAPGAVAAAPMATQEQKAPPAPPVPEDGIKTVLVRVENGQMQVARNQLSDLHACKKAEEPSLVLCRKGKYRFSLIKTDECKNRLLVLYNENGGRLLNVDCGKSEVVQMDSIERTTGQLIFPNKFWFSVLTDTQGEFGECSVSLVDC